MGEGIDKGPDQSLEPIVQASLDASTPVDAAVQPPPSPEVIRFDVNQLIDAKGQLNRSLFEEILSQLSENGQIDANAIQRRCPQIYTFMWNRSGRQRRFKHGLNSLIDELGLPYQLVVSKPSPRLAPQATLLPKESRPLVETEWTTAKGELQPTVRERITALAAADRTITIEALLAGAPGLVPALRARLGQSAIFGVKQLQDVVRETGLDIRVKHEKFLYTDRAGTPKLDKLRAAFDRLPPTDEPITPEYIQRNDPILYRFLVRNIGPARLFPQGYQSVQAVLGLPFPIHVMKKEYRWLLPDGSPNRADIERALQLVAKADGTVTPKDVNEQLSSSSIGRLLKHQYGPKANIRHDLQRLVDDLKLPFRIESATEWILEGGVPNPATMIPIFRQVMAAEGIITDRGVRRVSDALSQVIRSNSGPGELFPDGYRTVLDTLGLNEYPFLDRIEDREQRRGSSATQTEPRSDHAGRPTSPRRRPGDTIDFAEISAHYTERSFTTVVDDRPLPSRSNREQRDATTPPSLTQEIEDVAAGLSLTGAEQLRLLIQQIGDQYRSSEEAQLYAEYVGELPSYLVHRARIAVLAQYFFERHRTYPSDVADLGAGPSVGYLAYQELAHLFADRDVEPPHVIDVDSSLAMLGEGLNPDRRHADISERLPLHDGSVELVESSYVLHHFAPEAIRRVLAEAHRVLRWGTYVVLTSPVRFSREFLTGTEQLGFEVQTAYGTRLAATDEFLAQLTSVEQERAKQKLASSYLLILCKDRIPLPDTLPDADQFTFDRPPRAVGAGEPTWYGESTEPSLVVRDVRGRVEQLLREVGRALDQLRDFDRIWGEVHGSKRPTGPSLLARSDERRHYQDELRHWLETNLNEHVSVLAHVEPAHVDAFTRQQLTLLKLKLRELSQAIGTQ